MGSCLDMTLYRKEIVCIGHFPRREIVGIGQVFWDKTLSRRKVGIQHYNPKINSDMYRNIY